MSTYLIGDIQGCFDELQNLLQLIDFNPQKDSLGLVGDLVNRGPKSLETLRFLKTLPNCKIVLGNHDLFLLILGYELAPLNSHKHTLHEICQAPDKLELLDWLRHQDLFYANDEFAMMHAGIPPQWKIAEAQKYASEVHSILRGKNYKEFLRDLFGNEPSQWNEKLSSLERWRYIVNAFTRMRFCKQNGELEFDLHDPAAKKAGFRPWFEWRSQEQDKIPLYFGHWAALNGKSTTAHIHALDTGCAWGHELTAICVETQERFRVSFLGRHRRENGNPS